jgi:hypothetical protein
MENLDAGKALQGGFYAVYDVHQAILPTAAGVGQSVLRWRHVRHTAGSAQVADPDYRFARRDRSRAGGHRVHLGLLVATTTQRQAAAGARYLQVGIADPKLSILFARKMQYALALTLTVVPLQFNLTSIPILASRPASASFSPVSPAASNSHWGEVAPEPAGGEVPALRHCSI